MSNHSEAVWAFVATSMAGGSFLGSIVSLTSLTQKISWHYLHVLCGLFLGIQLFVLSLSVTIFVLCFACFSGAAFVTVNGIRWDTIGQDQFSGKKLHLFA